MIVFGRAALTFMSAMSSCGFPEPPTRASLTDARRVLDQQRNAVDALATRIQAAEDELKHIVRTRRDAIQEMEKERATAEDQVSRTLAYLSHIRRLPHELLGQIFMFIFDDYPCCAWVLAAVCSPWRRQVLSMPRLWSKVRTPPTYNLIILEWHCLLGLSPVPWPTALRAVVAPTLNTLSIRDINPGN